MCLRVWAYNGRALSFVCLCLWRASSDAGTNDGHWVGWVAIAVEGGMQREIYFLSVEGTELDGK